MKYSKEFLRSIVQEYETPLIIYNENEIRNNYNELQKTLGEESIIVYSMKANPNPLVIKVLDKCGAWFETASYNEFELLMDIGIDVNKVIYSGQAKRGWEIEKAIIKGSKIFNIESIREAKLLVNIANKHKVRIQFMCRINPSLKKDNNAILKMGSEPTAFGMEEADLITVISIAKDSYADLAGLFMYNGSQYYNPEEIVSNCIYLQEKMKKVQIKYNIVFSMIDYGGGFGVIESENQKPLNMKVLKELLEKDLEKCNKISFFESGRFLITSGGNLLCSVIDVKYSKGKKFVILDAGINTLGVRQLCYRLFDTFIESNNCEDKEQQIIVGPTCTTIDNVHQEFLFDKLNVGDIVNIPYAGSYLLTYSPIFFCNQVIPKEIMIYNDGSLEINKICSEKIYANER